MSSELADRSAVNGWNGEYVQQMHEQWSADPNSVDPSWQQFFQGFQLGSRLSQNGEHPAEDGGARIAHTGQGKVDSLIYHYRAIGHLAAQIDPLGTERPFPEYLELSSFDLSEDDLDREFDPGHLPLPAPAKLRDIIDHLQATYCRHIGVEYMHIQDREQRRWLQQQIEPNRNQPDLDREQKMRILRELMEADGLEKFLAVRYQGKKRFSLEGGETLNCMLNEIIDMAPGEDVEELTIGMAHRGRINVLVNIMNKTYAQLFTEFEESWVEDFIEGGGDVKYHRGYSSDHVTSSGDAIRLTLSPNPSHLEFVNPVVVGRARAKQRTRKDSERRSCVPILIHGDAAFPAQGIVAELFNMTHLDGYTVGGSIHLIVNNQVGFTTNPSDAHSGTYCTEVAKMVEAPIFHVNGADPEACAYIARLALDYRQKYRNDVVIDMWCYRKYGHNEGDEPAFTQPLLYQRIKDHTPNLESYSQRLIEEGVLTEEEFNKLQDELKNKMDEAQTRTKDEPVSSTVEAFRSSWSGLTEEYNDDPIETGVSKDKLAKVADALGHVPSDFNLHKALKKRLVGPRGEMVESDTKLDWGMGEMLAYGTLLLEGHAVRLTGQDVERGTFSHRHAVLFDQKTGEPYTQLNHIDDDQARFCIHNSPLTENACVGFEYGYSLGDPNMLVIWEAQFGDFCNGAQVFYDQFLSSAEVKWDRYTGLTLFLPHGYEGAGPEHSSARLERFLAQCAQNNMQVAYPTTPAQHFHMLRRQMKRKFRKPLIVMTPKSLLRHPRATSAVDDLVNDRFHHVLDDASIKKPDAVKRIIFCSGKVFYDLIEHRKKTEHEEFAVVRIEQLYPLRLESIRPILKKYKNAAPMWVQEEPKNMGAWRYIDARFREDLDITLPYVGRDEAASPAVASEKMHKQEQHKIMVAALGLEVRSQAISAEDVINDSRKNDKKKVGASA